MSVIYTNSTCAILDHAQWLACVYNKVLEDQSILYELFDVSVPFMMDGAAQKEAKKLNDEIHGVQCEPQKKKRKRGCPLQSSELNEEKTLIINKLQDLVNLPQYKIIFSHNETPGNYELNNINSRNAVKRLFELTECMSSFNPAGGNSSSEVRVLGEKQGESAGIFLPPHVQYFQSNVQNLNSILSESKFDIIVMDPPWYNKHIKRKKKTSGSSYAYDMMSVEDICSIPLRDVMAPGSLVFVWITNNINIIEDFTIQAQQAWNVHLLQTWYWLKVTKSGRPVHSLTDSHSKLPYERLLVMGNRESVATRLPLSSIPSDYLIVSTPSALHSHKPPLSELLQQLGLASKEDKCLELFARSLVPGWCSVGLEVLKLQHSAVYSSWKFQEL